MKLHLNPEYGLYESGGKAFCDSLQIAETFGKRHGDVIRTIENLGCSADFNQRNFASIKYKDDRGRSQPKYIMTKDGFTLLVMGYTGKKAMAFKEAYITRFNQMETYIRDLVTARMEFPELTNAINAAYDTPRSYHYSNEIDMINRIATGHSAKQIREMHGIEKGDSIRPYLSQTQITAITKLQKFDAGLLLIVPDYNERKTMLSAYYLAIQDRALIA